MTDRVTSRFLRQLPWELQLGEETTWRDTAIRCVKSSRSRKVLRLEPSEATGSDESIFAKRYLNKYWWRRVAWMVGQSKAHREARILRRLSRIGFIVPQVVGVAAGWGASYLATYELPEMQSLGEALNHADSEDAKTEFWKKTGQFLYQLWECGIFHPDLLQEHVCYLTDHQPATDTDENDDQPFALLDCDGVQFYKPSRELETPHVPMKHRCFNAMQILRSVDRELGQDDQRISFLQEAFVDQFAEVDFPSDPLSPQCADDDEQMLQKLLSQIHRAAQKQKTKTHLEHLLKET